MLSRHRLCPGPAGPVLSLRSSRSRLVNGPSLAHFGAGFGEWRKEMVRVVCTIRPSFRSWRPMRSHASPAHDAECTLRARVKSSCQQIISKMSQGFWNVARRVAVAATSTLPTSEVERQPASCTAFALVEVVLSLRLRAVAGSNSRMGGFWIGEVDATALLAGADGGNHSSGPLGIGRYFTRGPPFSAHPSNVEYLWPNDLSDSVYRQILQFRESPRLPDFLGCLIVFSSLRVRVSTV
jgi:hypothetical protein